ncbi:MAG: phosphate ABC transporter substrate-binding/OmpA family protein [Candidatus Eremiobacterota bacterium]
MSEQKQAGLTGLGKVIVFVVVAGLLYLGYSFMGKKPGGDTTGQGSTTGSTPVATTGGGTPGGGTGAEDTQGQPGQVTTVQEYAFVPEDKLPPVKGVSAYKWDAKNKVVEFPINVWIGWLPIVAANHGFAPNEQSVFFKKYGFKVNLNLIDDPVVARDAYASGQSHVLWGTLDMIVLFSDELMKDPRTAPRVFQQVDWSSGGDGIVVRERIKSVKDLKGKTIVFAQNSPSQYYITSLLLSAGLNPKTDVKIRYTATAFEAAAAYDSDPKIDACVSWAPDIYNLVEKRKGNRLLSSTAEANKLIADVWAVRADFARDHPDVVYGLVAGIFEGMEMTRDPKSKTYADAVKWMAEGYSMKPEDIMGMSQDAHSTNFGENKDFFLNANSPTNFERTWKSISYAYKELGLIRGTVRFDQVMDFSVIKKLDAEGKFKEQKNENTATFAPTTYGKVSAESPVVTTVLHIQFYPNSSNLHEPARDEYGAIQKNSLYDPNVDTVIERAAKLAGQFSNARIAIVGHTDASRKGQVDENEVKALSMQRAQAVKDELVKKFKFDPNKFVVQGAGWDVPADPEDPENHFKNRRVEISVYQLEQE